MTTAASSEARLKSLTLYFIADVMETNPGMKRCSGLGAQSQTPAIAKQAHLSNSPTGSAWTG